MGAGHTVECDPEANCNTLRGYKIGGAKEPPDRMKDAVMEGEVLFALLFEPQNGFDIVVACEGAVVPGERRAVILA